MNLYKATRPDGTDFRTGEIDYGAATCPTCGSPVEVVSSDEGTHHYRPVHPRVCDTWDCTGIPVAEFRWHEDHMGMQIGNYCEECLTALENGGWDGTTVRYPARVDPEDVERLREMLTVLDEEWEFYRPALARVLAALEPAQPESTEGSEP